MTPHKQITFKDFKIGQPLICVKQQTSDYLGGSPGKVRLILGETYTITDLEFRYPDRVCVKLKGPYYFHEEFVPIECFDTISQIRDQKLDQLGI